MGLNFHVKISHVAGGRSLFFSCWQEGLDSPSVGLSIELIIV